MKLSSKDDTEHSQLYLTKLERTGTQSAHTYLHLKPNRLFFTM